MMRFSSLLAIALLCATSTAADESTLSPEVLVLCQVPSQKLGSSISQVESVLGKATSIGNEWFPNRYDERVKDSRITLNYEKTTVSIYAVTLMGRFYLESIKTEENLPLFSGMSLVGATLENLKKALGSPSEETDTQVTYWCSEEFGMGFVFTLRNARVQSFTWHNGID